MFGDIFDVDQWPSAVVSIANSLEPSGLDRETGGGVKVPNGRFDAGEFVHIVDILPAMCQQGYGRDVLSGDGRVGNFIHRVQACMAEWMIEYNGVHVLIANVWDMGDTP